MPLLGTAAGVRAAQAIVRSPRYPGYGVPAVERAASFVIDANTDGLDHLIAGNAELAEHVVAYVARRTAGRARINIRAVEAIDTSFMVNTTRARRVSRFLWSVGTAAFYGVFVEFGTIRMAARPWLLPAMYEASDLFAAMLRIALPELASSGHVAVPDGGSD